jgi:hypothetical protein
MNWHEAARATIERVATSRAPQHGLHVPTLNEFPDVKLHHRGHLPKLGIEGRYQGYPACPWTVRVGPKQTFSGILQGGEHGTWFLSDVNEPLKGTDAWFEWRFGPNWGIWADNKADRSLPRLKVDPFDPIGPPHRVKLRGWRTVQPGKFGYAYYVQKPHVLFVDEFISAEPEA